MQLLRSYGMKTMEDIGGLIVDPTTGTIEYTCARLRLSLLSEPVEAALVDIPSARSVFFDSNFIINATELNYIQREIGLFK
jgi:hypothetical protein